MKSDGGRLAISWQAAAPGYQEIARSATRQKNIVNNRRNRKNLSKNVSDNE